MSFLFKMDLQAKFLPDEISVHIYVIPNWPRPNSRPRLYFSLMSSNGFPKIGSGCCRLLCFWWLISFCFSWCCIIGSGSLWGCTTIWKLVLGADCLWRGCCFGVISLLCTFVFCSPLLSGVGFLSFFFRLMQRHPIFLYCRRKFLGHSLRRVKRFDVFNVFVGFHNWHLSTLVNYVPSRMWDKPRRNINFQQLATFYSCFVFSILKIEIFVWYLWKLPWTTRKEKGQILIIPNLMFIQN